MEGQSGLSELSVMSWVSAVEGYPLKRGSTVIPAALNLLHSPLLNEQNLYNVHNLPVPSCSEHKGVDSAILLAVSCPDHTYERWPGSHTTSYEFFKESLRTQPNVTRPSTRGWGVGTRLAQKIQRLTCSLLYKRTHS